MWSQAQSAVHMGMESSVKIVCVCVSVCVYKCVPVCLFICVCVCVLVRDHTRVLCTLGTFSYMCGTLHTETSETVSQN